MKNNHVNVIIYGALIGASIIGVIIRHAARVYAPSPERSLLEDGTREMKRYSKEIAANPWMSKAAEHTCKKLASGDSIEDAGAATAFVYGKQMLDLVEVRAGDSLKTMDQEKLKEKARPVFSIVKVKCPGLVVNAPIKSPIK